MFANASKSKVDFYTFKRKKVNTVNKSHYVSAFLERLPKYALLLVFGATGLLVLSWFVWSLCCIFADWLIWTWSGGLWNYLGTVAQAVWTVFEFCLNVAGWSLCVGILVYLLYAFVRGIISLIRWR